jgi:hypothetical protein
MKRALGCLLLLAACSGVDPKVAEDRVRKIAEGSLSTPVSKVDCPRAPNRKGSVFTCHVEFAEGGDATMRMEITDGFGNFEPSWVPQVVSRKNLGPQIAAETGGAVDCGSGVIAAPAQVACTRDGVALPVAIDPQGNVTW